MLSAKMADMPAHLRTAANLIDASVDLSRPFRKYWSETSKEFRQYVAQRYKALAVLFRDFASELEQKKLNGQTSTKFGPDPEITNGFEHWLVEFIQSKRGDKAAIDPDLIFSEIKHITGENSSLYAKRHGYSSLKNMLKSLHLIKIIPKGTGYAVALHEDAERQKRLRTWRDRSIFILIVTSPWFFSAKNGDTVSFDRLAAFPIRRATGINDEITSYLKISGQSLKEMFSAVSGMSYISDANGGTFKIENIDLIRQRIYPASYKK